MIMWFLGAAFAGILVLGVSLAVGAVGISLSELLTWATGQAPEEDLASRVLSGVRFPRSVAAIIVGATLGASGASLQAIHRTRIVDPHLVGISAAAGLGVAIGYAAFPGDQATVGAVALAGIMGVAYALATRMLGRTGGGAVLVVLMGIAAGLAITAVTGLVVLALDSPAVPTLSFFIFGSLVGAKWLTVAIAAVPGIVGLALLWWMGPGLDLLALGEQSSTHLGFDARRRIPVALTAIGIATGAAVALGGVIGFVGLVVPLAVRPMVGSTQRILIPAAAISGATAVLLLDIAARTFVSPVEIPIGLLTGAIGGPVLVWLVRREVVR